LGEILYMGWVGSADGQRRVASRGIRPSGREVGTMWGGRANLECEY
jgi:hypothetical protein